MLVMNRVKKEIRNQTCQLSQTIGTIRIIYSKKSMRIKKEIHTKQHQGKSPTILRVILTGSSLILMACTKKILIILSFHEDNDSIRS